MTTEITNKIIDSRLKPDIFAIVVKMWYQEVNGELGIRLSRKGNGVLHFVYCTDTPFTDI